MEYKEFAEQLIDESRFVSVDKGVSNAPECPGIYCIKINNKDILPDECKKALNELQHNILYIGVAENLQKRLKQELYATGHGTFFRSIGAVLGFLPPKGSLLNKKNKNNYKFSPTDTDKIIEIMKENFIINYIETEFRNGELETKLIEQYKPIINIDKNPNKLYFVENRRGLCRKFANQECDMIQPQRKNHTNNSFTPNLQSLLLVIGIIILICFFMS